MLLGEQQTERDDDIVVTDKKSFETSKEQPAPQKKVSKGVLSEASTTASADDGLEDPEPFTWVDWVCWYVVSWGFLLRFQKGFLKIRMPNGVLHTFGDHRSDLQCELQVFRPRLFRRFLLGESIGMAESYMDGDWTCEDLTSFVALVLEQDKAGVLVGLPYVKEIEIKVRSLYNYLFRAGYHFEFSLANVQQHYDIGNDLYERMLDPSTFSYTCALYRNPFADQHFIAASQFGKDMSGKNELTHQAYKSISLDQAQLNKIHLLIKKGNIQRHHRVLELGCGFGGFSCELAKQVGCRVDCYNLSVEQLALARARAKKAGVEHLINYMHDDYRACVHYYPTKEDEVLRDGVKSELSDRRKTGSARNLWNQYDVIVSIGMLEHVGHNDLVVFFETCDRMLKPGGTAVVHTITSNDFGYEHHKVTYGFIQKYIFPGACIPAVGAIVAAATGHSKFELQHFENIGQHYAPTLRHWRENFYRNLDEIMALKDENTGKPKYDSKFIRMWDFYLCNCEAEFITGHFGLGQFVWKRPSSEYTDKAARDRIIPVLPSLSALPDDEVDTYGNVVASLSGSKKTE
ncbi:unnamed protein product [Amoebophrya sp. A120]|nr:unnamed protein product [Amoebophrya sp. A120]|eukprot:GSA120T00021359001.1